MSGEITLARQGVAALAALRHHENGGDLSFEQTGALIGWPGWGPLARAFNHGGQAGAWEEIAGQVRELLTPTEYEAARYVVDTAFYTPPTVTAAVWRIVRGLGFRGGRVLEPGCGAGYFIASAPAGLHLDWTGVEADEASARIAQVLHPQAKIIHGRLEKTPLRAGRFDLVVGNVPFSSESPYDPAAPAGLSLHNYFIWRALSAVRPGGLVALVTSRWTLDAAETVQREELAVLGAFLGAIRLPGSALVDGGTRAVTDIVVFRRHADGDGDFDIDERWLHKATQPFGLSTTVSSYFQANPHMVAGEMTDRAGVRYGMTLDVSLPEGQELGSVLDDAAARLVSEARAVGLTWCPPPRDIPADDAGFDGDPAKEGAYTLHRDGTVTRQRDGKPEAVRAGRELTALIGLRDAATALFAAEANRGMHDLARSVIRDRARRLYREYTAQFGYLNRSDLSEKPDPDDPGETIIVRKRPVMGGFRTDPDYPTVLALEIWDDDAQTGEPAPILLRHVNAPPRRKTRTDHPGEALALCLDAAGRVSLGLIAGLLGVDTEMVPGLLQGQIWEDPGTGGWVTAEEYLSGDVRARLTAAKAAAGRDPRWQGHVEALEKVQPADLGPEDISVQLGAPWIPATVVRRFIAALLGTRPAEVTVRYVPLTSAWEVRVSKNGRRGPGAAEWGTTRVNAVDLVEDALNGSAPIIYDTHFDPITRTDYRVRNQTETALAADKIRDLNERFAEWLWEDAERADQMTRLYNDRFNCTRVRRYDGSLLTFPGMSGEFTPYQSQRDMVWRSVCTPAALCGHTVGAGKTAIMVMTAMTLRRLGLARKPAMIVPNHLLEQETAEARRLYPGARILMVTREDLTAERRRAFAAKVGARDWDLIVMTHQQFMALPVSDQVQADFIAGQIEDLDEAMMDSELEESRSAKQLAKRRKKLLARHEELLHAERDGGITFEQTGIDYLMIDEGHLFKNLALATRAEGFSVSGSKRADDLAMKLGLLRDRNADGRCGTLYTGTPISNSLAELFILFLYLDPAMLKTLGLRSFDGFAAQFIRYATQTEVAPDGSGFRSHRRPVKYCNLPELRGMLGLVADIRTRADLQLAGPEVSVEHVPCQAQPELASYTATLVERADKIRSGGVKPQEDNMLSVCGDGRRAALDLRLAGIEPTGPGKLEEAAARIAAEYKATRGNAYSGKLTGSRPGGFQLVFCDQGTPGGKDGDQVYGRLRDLLTAGGVPAGEIAFVHAAKTHGDRSELFTRCRRGDVAVLIASTEKAGTGVNIQPRMTAIHHLDAPWRPADVEQRDGRGDRPGNQNAELRVSRYVTERSFDAYMWQALHRKAAFIAQILTGDLDVREVDDGGNPQVLSFGELKALATGQPLLMELAQVNNEIARLRNQQSGHKRSQSRMRGDYQAALNAARMHSGCAYELDRIARSAAAAGDERVLRTDRERFTDVAGIAEELRKVLAQARDRRNRVYAGVYRGVAVHIELVFHSDGAPKVNVHLSTSSFAKEHAHVHRVKTQVWGFKGDPGAMLAEIDGVIDDAAQLAEARRAAKAEEDARAEGFQRVMGQEWPHKQELAAALRERARIEQEIDAQVKTETAKEAA